MNAHTPGPWIVVPGDSVVFVRSESAAGDIVVTNRKPYFERHDETDLANARLIAVAPDMLALLRELIDIEGQQPGTADWAKKVLATIAKATGQEGGWLSDVLARAEAES